MHAISTVILRRCAALLLCAPLAALANPTGGQVVAGSATINHQGATTTITQGTDRAVINWNDFNVGAGELTRFVQPGAQSAVLNRVTGGNPTQIFGRLEGNGRVFVLNPNGVLVGAGGVVQTQSFIASTLNVANTDFMSGGDLRFTGSSTAAVENLGRIDAGQGDAVLIAHRVRNAGEIAATHGTVALAAGTDVVLAAEGDTRVWVKSGVNGAGGTGVDQSGTVSAVQAELKAAGGNVYSLAVNSSGLVSATGLAERNGRIYLTSEGGNVEVSGTLQARGAEGKGGEIYVGGGYQGKDAGIANAANTTVTAASRLNAGGETHQGGKIVVWANDHTNYAGALTTGHGGEVEVSGKGTLDFTGTVNTRGGRLLLDPTDITIDNSNFATLIGNPLLTGAVVLSATNDITYNTSNPIQSNYPLLWIADRDVILAPTSSFGSMGAGNNVDFQVYAGRDFIMNAATSIAFSGDGHALIRAGRDLTMGASATISFGSGGWVLLSADTANSTRPAYGTGKITLDTTAYLNATKIQAFAPAPAQFVNNSAVTFAAPTYDKWEEDIDIEHVGSGLWFKSGSGGIFAPPTSILTIAANNFTRSYGDPNPTFTANYSGFVNGDTSALVTGLQFSTTATQTSPTSHTYAITPFGATAPAYYTLSYVPGTLTIVPAIVTVTPVSFSRFYGDPNGTLALTYSGFKLGQTASVLTTQPRATTTATTASYIGTYPITVSGGDSTEYSLRYETGALTVLKAPLVIKANDTSRSQNASNPAFSATFTGFKNGDTAAMVSNLGFTTPATPSSGAGAYAITPFGASALNYTLTYQAGVLTVNPIQVIDSTFTTTTLTTTTSGGSTTVADVRTPVEKYVDERLAAMKARQDYGAYADLADTARMLLDESFAAYHVANERDDDYRDRLGKASSIIYAFVKSLADYGFTPDTVGFADSVHQLMPAWFETIRDKYKNDPNYADFFKLPDAQKLLVEGCSDIAFSYRNAQEVALKDKLKPLLDKAEKLEQQIATIDARLKVLDATFSGGASGAGDITVLFTGIADTTYQNSAEHDRLLSERAQLVIQRQDPTLDAFKGSILNYRNPPKPGERDYMVVALDYLVRNKIISL